MSTKTTLSILITLALCLTACVPIDSLDLQISLKQADQWDVDGTLVAVGSGQDQAAGTVAQELAQMEDEYTRQGVIMDWNQLPVNDEGNTPFHFVIQGISLDEINTTFFTQNAFWIEEVNGQRQVHFSMQPTSSVLLKHYSVTLKGKRIISSNGKEIARGTVRWINPLGEMDAVMVEGTPGISSSAILLIAAAMILAAVFIVRRRPRNHRQPVYPPGATPQPGLSLAIFCRFCGYTLPANADFCPNCGNRR